MSEATHDPVADDEIGRIDRDDAHRAALVARARDGDREAQDLLGRWLYPIAVTAAGQAARRYPVLRDGDGSHHLVGEAWEWGWTQLVTRDKLGAVRGDARGYLHTVMANKLLDRARKELRGPSTDLLDESVPTPAGPSPRTPEDEVVARDSMRRLVVAKNRLLAELDRADGKDAARDRALFVRWWQNVLDPDRRLTQRELTRATRDDGHPISQPTVSRLTSQWTDRLRDEMERS